MATTNFVTLIQVRGRMEDCVKSRRIFNHGKPRFQIEQNLSKKHNEGITPDATQKGKIVQDIKFHKK